MSNIWSMLGPEVAVLSKFDDAVKAFMTQANLRGGVVAVVKHNRLVFARSYTYADASYPL